MNGLPVISTLFAAVVLGLVITITPALIALVVMFK